MRKATGILIFLLMFISLICGFFIGRSRSVVKTEVKYVVGKTMTDTLFVDRPVKTETPNNPILPLKYDTVYVNSTQYVTVSVDTPSIISDYINKNTYSGNLFNDERGRFDYAADVQYNKLLQLGYEFTPIVKKEVKAIEPLFQPFISVGYSTNRTLNVGGGVFIRDIGVEYNFNSGMLEGNNYHSFKLKYKF